MPSTKSLGLKDRHLYIGTKHGSKAVNDFPHGRARPYQLDGDGHEVYGRIGRLFREPVQEVRYFVLDLCALASLGVASPRGRSAAAQQFATSDR